MTSIETGACARMATRLPVRWGRDGGNERISTTIGSRARGFDHDATFTTKSFFSFVSRLYWDRFV